MALDQQDNFDNLDNWNITNSDATFTIVAASNFCNMKDSTTSGNNTKGIVNKVGVTTASGYAARWTFKATAGDGLDISVFIGISKSATLSISGANSGFFRVDDTSGTLNLHSVESGVDETTDEITYGVVYEVRSIIDVSGSIEYWVKGGTEWPSFTKLFTTASTSWSGITVYGQVNANRVILSSGAEFDCGSWAAADTDAEIPQIGEDENDDIGVPVGVRWLKTKGMKIGGGIR